MREDYRLIVARFHKFQLLRRLKIQRFCGDIELHFGQLPLLEYVMNHDGCTQHEAAKTMLVSAPTVATSVKRLEKSGLLTKSTDEHNLRRSMLFLTDRGREMTLLLRERFDDLDRRTFDMFSEEELSLLSSMLDRMISSVSDGDDGGLMPQDIAMLVGKVHKGNSPKQQND